MGFWGTFVVHRGARPLTGFFADLEPLRGAEPAGRPVEGWSVTRVFDSDGELPEDFLTRLRDVTDAPALTARVLDSSAAYVCAAGVDTPPWQVWLQLQYALGYLLAPPPPFDEDGNYLGPDWADPEYEAASAALEERLRADAPGGVEGAGAAVAWAREAGLAPVSAEEVAALLDSENVLAEETFFAFLERLGVTAAKQ
ncbi:hypothetical protein [Virgisporangium aliadipatigenens]|uniref:hypothetical protein n=1 Tax=Virgisporangium aliadipatigenens TaxID=741659 RepID=UPI001943C466|nr:hypothetical protein [Virgisporangium aliadipatigenens]